MKRTIICIMVCLNGWTNFAYTQIIEPENILDSLFTKYNSINTISYVSRFVYGGTTDTAVSYQYFRKVSDENSYNQSFNIATYRFGSIHYRFVYNAGENISYHSSKYGSELTDLNNPPEHYPAMDEMLFSLFTLVKYLEQTERDHPGYIKIDRKEVNSKIFYSIKFKNPDGFTLENADVGLLTKGTFPLELIVDGKTGEITHFIWGYVDYKISDIKYNDNDTTRIWSIKNVPGYFMAHIVNKYKLMNESLLPRGSKIPDWNFATKENDNYELPANTGYTLLTFFTNNCGACINEIPRLNRLNQLDNLSVVGVFFGNDVPALNGFISNYKITYKVVLNRDDELEKQSHNVGFPVNYLINKDGQIVYSVLGNTKELEDQIAGIVKE